jgi:molybdopterin-containing oxidoreductase family membrane subunit
MNSGNKAVVGVFEFMDDAIKAIDFVKKKELDFRVYSPVPNHSLDHAWSPKRSNVRIISLIGGITGLTFGFALAIMCSLDYPLRVSAKDIVSVPGFVVIGYECTILFTALFTLKAVGLFGRVPDVFRKIGYDPRFTCDRFGVVVSCEGAEVDQVKSSLSELGAEEVDVRESL